MKLIIFKKNNQVCYTTSTRFWELATSGYFTQVDLIYDPASGQFLPASSYAELQPYLPNLMTELIFGVIKIAAVIIGVGLVIDAFEQPQQSRSSTHKKPNYVPIEAWKRPFVRERDNNRCAYCGQLTKHGHVDHKVSRINGGTNRLNNLCWSCQPCNQSKGRLNAREYKRAIGI